NTSTRRPLQTRAKAFASARPGSMHQKTTTTSYRCRRMRIQSWKAVPYAFRFGKTKTCLTPGQSANPIRSLEVQSRSNTYCWKVTSLGKRPRALRILTGVEVHINRTFSGMDTLHQL